MVIDIQAAPTSTENSVDFNRRHGNLICKQEYTSLNNHKMNQCLIPRYDWIGLLNPYGGNDMGSGCTLFGN